LLNKSVFQHSSRLQVVIPPHKAAIVLDTGTTQRDQHIQTITQQEPIPWHQKTGYNLRNYVEFAIQRYKRIFENTMKARSLPQQKMELWISVDTSLLPG
jgi:hypothetical protein